MNNTADKSVVLIGFMGSGKTTLGIRLSYRLKCVLEDTDKLIERQMKKTINEIFEQEGEEAFRQMETELLRGLSERKGQRVYSSGGGTPVRAVNRPLLRKLGMVVYLRVRPETVFERLQGDTTRPLLQGEDSLDRICRLMAQREAAYAETADVILDVDELTADQIIERILDCLGSM
ncbi:MAG: shikimate kinase [bacterium]|nr:shikimate kinase [bacterium]MCM1376375.1 shikimate kinase [Muribaculum sp.]